jgi:hypothetical protein
LVSTPAVADGAAPRCALGGSSGTPALPARAAECDGFWVRLRLLSLVALIGCVSCVSYLQQYVAFGQAPVYPSVIPAEVGDLVGFEVRPAVPAGSAWSLECKGRVRFVDAPRATSLDWIASPHAVHLETVVSPWDPLPPSEHTSRQWLAYSLREQGESNMLDRELPIRRVAFHEAGPVTFAATFALGGDTPTLSVVEQGDRIVATYRTSADKGVALAPKIDAMLLESGNRTILYAEVRTDFGDVAKEPMGYDVTLSYAKARVTGPVEIVVAGWTGHGEYWSPFTVTRYPARKETTGS